MLCALSHDSYGCLVSAGLQHAWYGCYYFAQLLSDCVDIGWGGSCCDTMYWYGVLCQGHMATLAKYSLVPSDGKLIGSGCVANSALWFYSTVSSPCSSAFSTTHACGADAVLNNNGDVTDSGCCPFYRDYTSSCSLNSIAQVFTAVANNLHNGNPGGYLPPGNDGYNAYGAAGMFTIIGDCARFNST